MFNFPCFKSFGIPTISVFGREHQQQKHESKHRNLNFVSLRTLYIGLKIKSPRFRESVRIPTSDFFISIQRINKLIKSMKIRLKQN